MKNMPISPKTKSIIGYIADLMITNNQAWFSMKAMEQAVRDNLPMAEGKVPSVVYPIMTGGADAGLMERREASTDSGRGTYEFRTKTSFRDDDLQAAYTLFNTSKGRKQKADMVRRVTASALPLVPELPFTEDSNGPTTLSDIIAMIDDLEDGVVVIKTAIMELKERLA